MVYYLVVSNHDIKELAKEVQKMIEAGWKLQGGISCSITTDNDTIYKLFAQAMKKKS